MRYQAALRPDGRGINVASPRGPSQGLRVDDVGDTVLSVEATMRAWVTVGLLGFLGSSAFAGIDPACLGVAQPADYDEQTQGDFQANYFALASSFSALHAPIPHEPGHGAIGIDARVMPPLSCERRFVLNWTKTEQTNKSPLIPTIRASFAFPAIAKIVVPYAGVGILPPVPLPDPENPKGALPACDGKTPLTQCKRSSRNLVLGGEVGVGVHAHAHVDVGVRAHATTMRTYGDIATAFDEAAEPSIEDIYNASTWGIGAQIGSPWEIAGQKLTPYVGVGYLDASTFFFVGDDNYPAINLHPYAGPEVSVGLDGLFVNHLRLAGEFYAAPGGSSLPDASATKLEGYGRYGQIYTARARIAYEF